MYGEQEDLGELASGICDKIEGIKGIEVLKIRTLIRNMFNYFNFLSGRRQGNNEDEEYGKNRFNNEYDILVTETKKLPDDDTLKAEINEVLDAIYEYINKSRMNEDPNLEEDAEETFAEQGVIKQNEQLSYILQYLYEGTGIVPEFSSWNYQSLCDLTRLGLGLNPDAYIQELNISEVPEKYAKKPVIKLSDIDKKSLEDYEKKLDELISKRDKAKVDKERGAYQTKINETLEKLQVKFALETDFEYTLEKLKKSKHSYKQAILNRIYGNNPDKKQQYQGFCEISLVDAFRDSFYSQDGCVKTVEFTEENYRHSSEILCDVKEHFSLFALKGLDVTEKEIAGRIKKLNKKIKKIAELEKEYEEEKSKSYEAEEFPDSKSIKQKCKKRMDKIEKEINKIGKKRNLEKELAGLKNSYFEVRREQVRILEQQGKIFTVRGVISKEDTYHLPIEIVIDDLDHILYKFVSHQEIDLQQKEKLDYCKEWLKHRYSDSRDKAAIDKFDIGALRNLALLMQLENTTISFEKVGSKIGKLEKEIKHLEEERGKLDPTKEKDALKLEEKMDKYKLKLEYYEEINFALKRDFDYTVSILKKGKSKTEQKILDEIANSERDKWENLEDGGGFYQSIMFKLKNHPNQSKIISKWAKTQSELDKLTRRNEDLRKDLETLKSRPQKYTTIRRQAHIANRITKIPQEIQANENKIKLLQDRLESYSRGDFEDQAIRMPTQITGVVVESIAIDPENRDHSI